MIADIPLPPAPPPLGATWTTEEWNRARLDVEQRSLEQMILDSRLEAGRRPPVVRIDGKEYG